VIGFDTNILVRYLVQDDPIQSPIATELFERLTEDSPGFVSIVAIAETAWVLERTYGLTDAEIATVIERTLQTDALVIEDEQQVFEAVVALREGRGSFAVALIGALGVKAGCSHSLTFDQRALRLPYFARP